MTRVLPHGHYSEIAIEVRGTDLRAFVTGEAPEPGDEVGVRLTRALRYREGKLDDAPVTVTA